MDNTFDDMTNAQLKEACEDFGLEVIAKNPAKPNKGEYLAALNTFKDGQAAMHGEDDKEKEVVKPVADGSKRKPQSKSQLLKLDLFRKVRVVIRDMQESQTKDEMVSISWGNRSTGGQTDFVDLSGEPQYVRVGALNNIKDATMTVHTPKATGGVDMAIKKRFVVVDVEALSEKELEELANQQRMRNSKLA